MARKLAQKPRKQPRQARSRATVDAILSAAAQVFVKHGYAAGTTDRIAERAGVSIGSLYQYFPNKDALLTALAQRHVDEGFNRIAEILKQAQAAPPPLDVMLREFVGAMIALHENDPELHRVLFEEAPLPKTIKQDIRRREKAFAEKLAALLSQYPQFAHSDVRTVALVLVQTVEALVHENVLHPVDQFSLNDMAEELIRMLGAYLNVAEQPT